MTFILKCPFQIKYFWHLNYEPWHHSDCPILASFLTIDVGSELLVTLSCTGLVNFQTVLYHSWETSSLYHVNDITEESLSVIIICTIPKVVKI